jgi:hypothetical protein
MSPRIAVGHLLPALALAIVAPRAPAQEPKRAADSAQPKTKLDRFEL